MADQIYNKEVLRARAVAHLKAHGGHLTTGQMAMAMGTQLYAIDQVLEDAYQAGEVTFLAGAGWQAKPEVAKSTATDEADGALL